MVAHRRESHGDGPEGFRIDPEVAAALRDGQPVVALESTILAHGFEAPQNRVLAEEMIAAARQGGALPAVIALADGAVQVGCPPAMLDRICSHGRVAKASRRDIAAHLATGSLAATTVAATAWAAWRCGIAVFATGGIGGVHRQGAVDGGRFPDISADLAALGETPIAVVSAGAKSILDLPATMEALEAHGVPLVGYRTGEFPAFHAADSGIPLAHRVEDIAGLAALVRTHRRLDLPGAVLVVQPPPEGERIPMAQLEGWIALSLRQAAAEGIAGPAVTPFLLAALDRLSAGRTSQVNAALAVANASLGAELAAALAHPGG